MKAKIKRYESKAQIDINKAQTKQRQNNIIEILTILTIMVSSVGIGLIFVSFSFIFGKLL